VAGALLAGARGTLTRRVEYPPERDVSAEEPRVGVFVCHCGRNIGGFLDVPGVAEYARTLPCVVHAEDNLYTCSQDSIARITEKTAELGLNRVVVASCTPLTHEPLFQDSIRAAGLNRYLFEMANIRNQCSWVHSDDWQAATQKARDLVRMAAAKAARLKPLHKSEVPVTRRALVLGGGPAGMNAALALAGQSIPVTLVEREKELGGNLRRVYYSLDEGCQQPGAPGPQEYLRDLVERVEAEPLITVHLETELATTGGYKGNFTSTLRAPGGEISVQHGATIIATGGSEYKGDEYGYGTDPRILTQQEFEQYLVNQETGKSAGQSTNLPNSVAMILCVGPAERYCSRICCTTALKNALKLKELNPEAQVTVFYKDIRAYGFKERLYTRAREKGVLFVRYDDDRPPEVTFQEQLEVRAWEPSLRQELTLLPDLLVLSTPMVPAEGTAGLATMFKVPVDLNGFFMEAHVKLRPVDFSSEGLYMAGAAHYPKLLDETIAQAQAAAARAALILTRDTLEVGGIVAQVDPELCVGCLTCVRICPFNVPQIRADLSGVGGILGAAYIEPAMCQGCGICAGECPARAIQLAHYQDEQMELKISVLLEPEVLEPVEG
jgi:heterodisulfide reductase subunit A-like polyferredoxin